MRHPQDKLDDARFKIVAIYHSKMFPSLQSLIGTLNFACKVVVPGRVFLRRFIDLTCGMRKPRNMVRLNIEARLDMIERKTLFHNCNGVAIILHDACASSDVIRLYSDASLRGFAVIYGKRW